MLRAVKALNHRTLLGYTCTLTICFLLLSVTNNSFAQESPYIVLNSTMIRQNSYVGVTGYGFTPNGLTNICISTQNVYQVGLCTDSPPTADSNGDFDFSLYVGYNVPVGPQQVWAKDMASGANTAAVTVTVIPPAQVITTQFQTNSITVTSVLTATTTMILEVVPGYLYWMMPIVAIIVALATYSITRKRKQSDVTKAWGAIRCSSCNFENISGSRFCNKCGSKLDDYSRY